MHTVHTPNRRDRGNVLPMVLVGSIVMSIIVAALSTYVATGLRYGAVVEDRADRLAAADGGLRYAVERLAYGAAQVCGAQGSHTIYPPDTNGAQVAVECQQVGSGFDTTNGWALILTGEGLSSTAPLMVTNSGVSKQKLVGGPVFMSRLNFDTNAPVEFRYSQLLYSGWDSNGDGSIDCDGTPTKPANISFDSNSLGLSCTPRPWNGNASSNGLFKEPSKSPLPTVKNPPSYVDSYGCKIFLPGHYDQPITLGSHNYFMSGNYLLDGIVMNIKSAKVTAGRRPGTSGDQATQFITNTPCIEAIKADTEGTKITGAGVTFYMKNQSRFVLDAHGTLEILRRKQGKTYVSIHVIDNLMSPTVDIINQGPGTNKDMALHGLVWAPRSRVTFGEVTNTANGQMLGGAVISNIDMSSSASSNDFIIAVEPSDMTGKLQLDSTALLDGQSTTIRSIVDFRPTTRYTAVTSWRVID